jgi:DNA mismatch endonuclease (patch repair protein)
LKKPAASSFAILKRMKNQKQRDTIPEKTLRSLLHRMGFRFRIDIQPIKQTRSRADIVFSKIKVALFVDGCFWHSCPLHGTLPKSNTEWWRAKLDANTMRDRKTNETLENAGWKVIRIWEHEEPAEAAKRIACMLHECYSALSEDPRYCNCSVK